MVDGKIDNGCPESSVVAAKAETPDGNGADLAELAHDRNSSLR